MFLAGIKFGMGFCIGMMVCATAAVLLPVYLGDWIHRYRSRSRKDVPKSGRDRLQEALWTDAPEPELKVRDIGSNQRVFVRSVITWGERDERDRRRKEPHYRH